MRVTASLAVLAAMLLVGCRGAAAAASPSPTIPVTDLSSLEPPTDEPSLAPADTPAPTERPTQAPPPTGAPTPTPRPQPTLASGSPTPNCVNGWVEVEPGSDLYKHALAVLGAQMGAAGPWEVDEVRYFIGPELPFVEPQHPSVERWYVKAGLADDPSFRARWLLERRTDLIQGISAVAQYDSAGYAPNVWTAFVGEGEPVSYIGLPGLWSGIPYDFVTGEGDSGNPGLPDEVAGCLSDT